MNHLKTALPLLFTLAALPELPAQPAGVQFQDAPAWEQVLLQASRERKLIFLDASTSWCGPCRRMEKEVFSRPDVGRFFNHFFIPVKYDMEEGEGVSLKKQYGVIAFPTYLFIDAAGVIAHRIVGAHLGEGEFVGYAREALPPGDPYLLMGERYRSGERQPAFLLEYLQVLEAAGQEREAEQTAAACLALMTKDHFLDSAYWRLIREVLKDPGSREFGILLENWRDIAAVQGREEVQGKIASAFEEKIAGNERSRSAEGAPFDEEAEERTLDLLRRSDFPRSKELLARALAARHLRRNDWEGLAYVADAMLDFDLLRDFPEPARELQRHAATIAGVSHDGRLLRRALRWAEFACENERRASGRADCFFTKAKILEKMGREAEAAEARADAELAAKGGGRQKAGQ